MIMTILHSHRSYTWITLKIHCSGKNACITGNAEGFSFEDNFSLAKKLKHNYLPWFYLPHYTEDGMTVSEC